VSSATGGLSIAILGTRGIPARYGGFETFAAEIAPRLAARGHRITVYRRSRYRAPGAPSGIGVITLPAIYSKHLETPSHTLLSVLHAARRRPQVALVCNAVNAVLLPLLSVAGVVTVLNVDGLEWRRRKWGVAARGVHRLSEHLAVAFADAVVTDALAIRDYYRARHGVATVFIPYGGDLAAPASAAAVTALGLRPRSYDLCVSRFEPENNLLQVVRARSLVPGDTPLVVVGGAPYSRRYEREVLAAAGPHVVFAGFVYGEPYRELLFNARATLHAAEVGGVHPALLEAMGAGTLVLFRDTPENREAAGEFGLPFPDSLPESLASVWRRVGREPGLRERLGPLAARTIRDHWRWEGVAEAYDRLFRDLASPP
jgi:glycosyltransferase involved in cell wall biosynthesis